MSFRWDGWVIGDVSVCKMAAASQGLKTQGSACWDEPGQVSFQGLVDGGDLQGVEAGFGEQRLDVAASRRPDLGLAGSPERDAGETDGGGEVGDARVVSDEAMAAPEAFGHGGEGLGPEDLAAFPWKPAGQTLQPALLGLAADQQEPE